MNSIILIAVFVAVSVVSMSEGSHMERAYRRYPELRKQMAEKQMRKQLQAENQQDYDDDSFNYPDDYFNNNNNNDADEDEPTEQPTEPPTPDRVGSCAELKRRYPNILSGDHDIFINIKGVGGVEREERRSVFCNFDELCGDDGGWLRVAHLDMTRGENCPANFQLFNQDGVQSCGNTDRFCSSQFFDTLDISYTKVCGRVTGFQRGSPDGFQIHSVNQRGNIETAYVDGVSITKGNPREHIWTYAATPADTFKWCPCDDGNVPSLIPPFVGNDYFCETGVVKHFDGHTLHTGDLLWDGQQCGASQEACCEASRNNPWFEKVLDSPSTDSIELRICGDEGIHNENVPVNFYEIYTKA